MKFLKKATLAAAVAVAPFAAQAELKAMDDAMMSATTGQAGVTIEIDMMHLVLLLVRLRTLTKVHWY